MSNLKEFVDKFNRNNPDPCWYYLEEMRPWSTRPCEPKPGETCPACGKSWEK